MKTSTLCIFLLLPQFASAQSSLSPEAQSAYDDAMRGVNETAASQIRQHESQSRQSQQNINQLLLDQQLERLSEQQAEFRRQELERQRRQQQLVEESLRQQRAGSVLPSWDYNQSPQHAPQAQSQPSIVGGDVFAKAVAELEMGNYAGNVPPPPTLQQPLSVDLMREAGLTSDLRVDVVGDLIRIEREKRMREAETYKVVIDALSKQGCIAFKVEVNNPFPVCSAWNTTSKSLPGVVGAATVGVPAVIPASQLPTSATGAAQVNPVVASGKSSRAPLIALGAGLLVIIALLALAFRTASLSIKENRKRGNDGTFAPVGTTRDE